MGNPSSEVLWEQDTTYCTPCLCLLCGRGSRPWMWEPRRQIHPAPSTTISDIPRQSRHIRWPCLLFCVSLSPVLSGTFSSGQTSVLCGPWAPEWVQRPLQIMHESKVRPKSTALGLESHPSSFISTLKYQCPEKCPAGQLSPWFSRTIFSWSEWKSFSHTKKVVVSEYTKHGNPQEYHGRKGGGEWQYC